MKTIFTLDSKCECKHLSARYLRDTVSRDLVYNGALPVARPVWIFSSRAASSPKKSIAFQSVLVRYSLGMPETSLSGRNTRIARNVRRSISRCMPCENAVMILPQKHTHPATLYYLLLYYTNTHPTLKYLYYDPLDG